MTITIDASLAWVRGVLITALAVLAWGASASAGTSINTGYFGGVAIKGYDPVAYFIESRAVTGAPEFSYEWLGATWQFATRKHRELFTENPMKYAPQYGGHCAAGAAFGQSTADIDPEAWAIVDGKLYLQYSKAALEVWEQDRANQIPVADQRWPEIKAGLESESGS